MLLALVGRCKLAAVLSRLNAGLPRHRSRLPQIVCVPLNDRFYSVKPDVGKIANHVVNGHASAEATKRFVDSHQIASTYLPRCGFHISRVGFGGDDYGANTNERAQQLAKAILRRGANVIQIDIDSLFARHQPNSCLYERNERALHWERHTLRKIMRNSSTEKEENTAYAKRNSVTRDEMVIIGKLGILGANVFTSPYDVDAVNNRVKEALNMLGLEKFDIVLVDLPVQSRFAVRSLSLRVLGILEELVSEGFTQFYGIGSEQFSPFDDADPSHGSISARTIFEAAESLSQNHKLVSIEYCTSLLEINPMLPTALDHKGNTWSLMELVDSYGIGQFIKSPLDCAKGGKIFRCINSDSHDDVSGHEISRSLDEAVNVAIHLERKFEFDVLPEMRKEYPSNGWLEEELFSEDYNWARTVGFNLHQMNSLLQWRFMWNKRVKPAMKRLLAATAKFELASQWTQAYRAAMFHMKVAIDQYVEKLHCYRAGNVSELFLDVDEKFQQISQLDWRVLYFLMSSPASCVLTEEPHVFNRNLNEFLPPKASRVVYQDSLLHLRENAATRMWPSTGTKHSLSRGNESGNIHPVADMVFEDKHSQSSRKSHAERMRKLVERRKRKRKEKTKDESSY